MHKNPLNLDGFLLLNKSAHITSNKALQQTKRMFNAKKAGHTGALDPQATGLLPILFGQGTKFANYLLDSDKSYEVVAKLGEISDTGDKDGHISHYSDLQVSVEDIKSELLNWHGETLQIPPMYSALKHKGKPLYKYIRSGIEIDRPARPVKISAIDFVAYNDNKLLRLDVTCSKGTYIRTLVEDIGKALGCGAYVESLHRTQVHCFHNSDAVDSATLEQAAASDISSCIAAFIRPLNELFTQMPKINLSADQIRDIQFGKKLEFLDNAAQNIVATFSDQDKFIGLCNIKDGVLSAQRLMSTGLPP